MIESTQRRAGLVRGVRADGRNVYEWDAKLAIVRAAIAPGASVARVALDHGINANLLRKWIVKHAAAAKARSASAPSALLPVVVNVPAELPAPKRASSQSAERAPIEIELPRGIVRFYGTIERSVLDQLIAALSVR